MHQLFYQRTEERKKELSVWHNLIGKNIWHIFSAYNKKTKVRRRKYNKEEQIKLEENLNINLKD